MMNWMISKTNLLQLPRFGAVSVAHGVVRLTIIVLACFCLNINWQIVVLIGRLNCRTI